MSEIVASDTLVQQPQANTLPSTIEALTTLQQELYEERSALWAKANAVAARLDEVEKRIEHVQDAEFAKQRVLQLQQDGYLMAFEEPHDRLFEHLAALVPGIVAHVALLHVTIDGWHLTGCEGVDEDSRDMDIGTLRMSGAYIPKDLRFTVNSQMLLTFIEEADLKDLNHSTLMDTLTYNADEDWTGQWTGDIPVYVVIKPDLAGGAKRAKKQK